MASVSVFFDCCCSVQWKQVDDLTAASRQLAGRSLVDSQQARPAGRVAGCFKRSHFSPIPAACLRVFIRLLVCLRRLAAAWVFGDSVVLAGGYYESTVQHAVGTERGGHLGSCSDTTARPPPSVVLRKVNTRISTSNIDRDGEGIEI